MKIECTCLNGICNALDGTCESCFNGWIGLNCEICPTVCFLYIIF